MNHRVPLLLLLFSGCTNPTGEAPREPVRVESKVTPPPEDLDGDGLCDESEAELSTDVTRADTDGDGFPDLLEVVLGVEATDPAAPDAAIAVYLAAEPGAEASLEVRVTVDGAGGAYSGAFSAAPAIYDVGHSAADFFVGAHAAGGLPVDNLRDVDGYGERFGSVLGSTRLRFLLEFAYPRGMINDPGCVVAHPFIYFVKDDVGRIIDQQEFLLVLARGGGRPAPEAYCIGTNCL